MFGTRLSHCACGPGVGRHCTPVSSDVVYLMNCYWTARQIKYSKRTPLFLVDDTSPSWILIPSRLQRTEPRPRYMNPSPTYCNPQLSLILESDGSCPSPLPCWTSVPVLTPQHFQSLLGFTSERPFTTLTCSFASAPVFTRLSSRRRTGIRPSSFWTLDVVLYCPYPVDS